MRRPCREMISGSFVIIDYYSLEAQMSDRNHSEVSDIANRRVLKGGPAREIWVRRLLRIKAARDRGRSDRGCRSGAAGCTLTPLGLCHC